MKTLSNKVEYGAKAVPEVKKIQRIKKIIEKRPIKKFKLMQYSAENYGTNRES